MNVQENIFELSRRVLSRSRSSAKSLLIQRPIYLITKSLPRKFQNRIMTRDFYYELFKPLRTQRFFLREEIGIIEFFDILNQRKVEYVLLRWWENLPSYPENEDINLLVRDEHRELLDDLVDRVDNGGIKCDIYTETGSKNGHRFNIPVFSQKLSNVLLEERIFHNSAYVPSPVAYFASVAYHAIFHKGVDSGVPGFHKKPETIPHDYSAILEKMAKELDLKIDISVTGVYNWLKKQGYAPADDTLAKLSIRKPELEILAQRLYSDIRGGELMVFVVRERLIMDGYFEDFVNFLITSFKFDLLNVKHLDEQEKKICSLEIRGGKWDKGPWEVSGGLPAALVVVFDYNPQPLDYSKKPGLNRITNENCVNAKWAYRKRLNSFMKKSENYNGVHSGDNEFDAKHYISLLGESYYDEILSEVENRRVRYSKRKVEPVEKVGSEKTIFSAKFKNSFSFSQPSLKKYQ